MVDLSEIRLEKLTDDQLKYWSIAKEIKIEDASFLMLDFTPKTQTRTSYLPSVVNGMKRDLLKYFENNGFCDFLSGKKVVQQYRNDPLGRTKTVPVPGKPIPRKVLEEAAIEMGIKPIFLFSAQIKEKDRALSVDSTLNEGKSNTWPWGGHETKLLQHLAAAADRFWKNYDPRDNTTAPTNEKVIDWLKTKGVGQRNAEVMATILRADGLPPGPRK